MKKTKTDLIDLARPRARTISNRAMQRVVGSATTLTPIYGSTAIDTIYSNGTHGTDTKSDDVVGIYRSNVQ